MSPGTPSRAACLPSDLVSALFFSSPDCLHDKIFTSLIPTSFTQTKRAGVTLSMHVTDHIAAGLHLDEARGKSPISFFAVQAPMIFKYAQTITDEAELALSTLPSLSIKIMSSLNSMRCFKKRLFCNVSSISRPHADKVFDTGNPIQAVKEDAFLSQHLNLKCLLYSQYSSTMNMLYYIFEMQICTFSSSSPGWHRFGFQYLRTALPLHQLNPGKRSCNC